MRMSVHPAGSKAEMLVQSHKNIGQGLTIDASTDATKPQLNSRDTAYYTHLNKTRQTYSSDATANKYI